jgi:hypothetical protein
MFKIFSFGANQWWRRENIFGSRCNIIFLISGNQTIPSDRESKIRILHEPEKIKDWVFILLTALCALGIFLSFLLIPCQIIKCRRLVLDYCFVLQSNI